MSTIYILSGRIGTELQTPFCGEYEEVYNRMCHEYESALAFLDCEERQYDSNSIEARSAVIPSDDEWYEWTITEQELCGWEKDETAPFPEPSNLKPDKKESFIDLARSTEALAAPVREACALIRRAAELGILHMPDDKSVVVCHFVEEDGEEKEVWVQTDMLEAAISLVNSGDVPMLKSVIAVKEEEDHA